MVKVTQILNGRKYKFKKTPTPKIENILTIPNRKFSKFLSQEISLDNILYHPANYFHWFPLVPLEPLQLTS